MSGSLLSDCLLLFTVFESTAGGLLTTHEYVTQHGSIGYWFSAGLCCMQITLYKSTLSSFVQSAHSSIDLDTHFY